MIKSYFEMWLYIFCCAFTKEIAVIAYKEVSGNVNRKYVFPKLDLNFPNHIFW